MTKKLIGGLVLTFLLVFPFFLLATGEPCENKSDCKGEEICYPCEGEKGICAPPGVGVYCPPLKTTSLTEIIDNIISWVLWIALVIAPVMVVIGGLLFLTAGGNTERVRKGKNILLWTILGFLFILFSKGVLNLIQSVIGVK